MGETAQWILDARKRKAAEKKLKEQQAKLQVKPTTVVERRKLKALKRSQQQTQPKTKHGKPC